MVRRTIEHHLPADQLDILRTAEQSEREVIANFVELLGNHRV
jgi:hypothetical protein